MKADRVLRDARALRTGAQDVAVSGHGREDPAAKEMRAEGLLKDVMRSGSGTSTRSCRRGARVRARDGSRPRRCAPEGMQKHQQHASRSALQHAKDKGANRTVHFLGVKAFHDVTGALEDGGTSGAIGEVTGEAESLPLEPPSKHSC